MSAIDCQVPTTPYISNNDDRICDQAFLGMPFTAILVGVDGRTPTILAYAMYDSSLAAVRFVLGNGKYANPENICYLESFRGGNYVTGFKPRLHYIDLFQRATGHCEEWGRRGPYDLAVYKGRFTTTNAVKTALEFYSDLEHRPSEVCRALGPLCDRDNYQPVPDDAYPAHLCKPCVPLSTPPKWDFDPRSSGQPRVCGVSAQAFKKKFKSFKAEYHYPSLSWDHFQQAAFCLVGLKSAGLVSPLVDQQQGQACTVDCFMTRYQYFLAFVIHMCFAECPNPLYWLAAELEDELRLTRKGPGYQLKRPWKGLVGGEAVSAVVDWQTLESLEWETKDAVYPRPFQAVLPHSSVTAIKDEDMAVKDEESPALKEEDVAVKDEKTLALKNDGATIKDKQCSVSVAEKGNTESKKCSPLKEDPIAKDETDLAPVDKKCRPEEKKPLALKDEGMATKDVNKSQLKSKKFLARQDKDTAADNENKSQPKSKQPLSLQNEGTAANDESKSLLKDKKPSVRKDEDKNVKDRKGLAPIAEKSHTKDKKDKLLAKEYEDRAAKDGGHLAQTADKTHIKDKKDKKRLAQKAEATAAKDETFSAPLADRSLAKDKRHSAPVGDAQRVKDGPVRTQAPISGSEQPSILKKRPEINMDIDVEEIDAETYYIAKRAREDRMASADAESRRKKCKSNSSRR